MRKVLIAAVIAGVFAMLTMGSAMADQTNGTGKSHLGFTVGYNVQADLSGHFEYQPTFTSDGTSHDIKCGQTGTLPDYTKYTETTTNDGFPKSIFNSTYCWDGDTRYYVHVEAIDRGEPGVNDSLCITVKLFPAKLNPTPLIKDCGIIQDGNVQIHVDTHDTIVDDGTAA
jgi:hypothetical protein